MDEALFKGQDFIEFQSHCARRIGLTKNWKATTGNEIDHVYRVCLGSHKGYVWGPVANEASESPEFPEMRFRHSVNRGRINKDDIINSWS